MSLRLSHERADRAFDGGQGRRLKRHFDTKVWPQTWGRIEFALVSEIGSEEGTAIADERCSDKFEVYFTEG